MAHRDSYERLDEDEKTREDKQQAKRDIGRRSASNISKYTPEQIKFGNELVKRLGDCYPHSRVFMNYRKTFIAVKAENPSVNDKNQNWRIIEATEQYATENGANVKPMRSHIIYEIPRKVVDTTE